MTKEFCPHCSQEIQGEAHFCPLCGQEILRPGQPATPGQSETGEKVCWQPRHK